jgi:hypothetical protein
MVTARKSARQRGKSDAIDALNVARVALQEGLDGFPAAHLDGPELDLRLLVDHRERLIRHRVELNSTLLWHPHDLWPELMLPGGALFSKRWSTRVGRRLARAEQTMRVRIARDELRRLRELTLAVRGLEREITELVTQIAPQLLTQARVRAADRGQARRGDRQRAAVRDGSHRTVALMHGKEPPSIRRRMWLARRGPAGCRVPSALGASRRMTLR